VCYTRFIRLDWIYISFFFCFFFVCLFVCLFVFSFSPLHV
jgi:hypothetical protein